VLESLYKFGGEQHELLQAGDYTQLTGRAGRRGIDRRGTAIVLHSPYLPFERVAAIAAAGAHPMRSSFRPTYNMAANLMAAHPREEAERLLNASFAQFQEDRLTGDLAALIGEEEERLAADREAALCELGFVGVPDEQAVAGHEQIMSAFVSSTAAGDVLAWPLQGGGEARQVVVARGHGKRPRVLTIAADGSLHRLAPEKVPSAAAVVGRLDLPEPYRPREPEYRREVTGLLGSWQPGGIVPRPAYASAVPAAGGAAACPDLAVHLAAARSARRREERLDALRRRARASGAGMVPRLRAIATLLQHWGYADGWRLTPAGRRLRFIYNELDLLLAESLERGLFDGLGAAETAALASLFTFEPRSEQAESAWPTGRLQERAERIWEIAERLASAEEGAGLPVTRAPDAGFVAIAYRWASGAGLQDLFGEEGAGVGDFVRNCRQLIDLLRQMGDVAPRLGTALSQALAAVDRGVVAASGAV